MHVPAISGVGFDTNKCKGPNTSFGAIKVTGNGAKAVEQFITSDKSLKKLSDLAELRCDKNIVIDVHSKYDNVRGDLFKLFAYIDEGPIGNLLNKMGLGRKIPLTIHHHSKGTIERRCYNGILNPRYASSEDAITKLGYGIRV